MHHATMILEGGATRGVFTSGVLDYLMEKEFYTSHVIGEAAMAWIMYPDSQAGPETV